jgi:hypothetical protein
MVQIDLKLFYKKSFAFDYYIMREARCSLLIHFLQSKKFPSSSSLNKNLTRASYALQDFNT